MINSDLNKKYLTISEVKNILKKIEKERNEISYEQRIALDHANKFAELPTQKIKGLIKELMELDYIEESHVYKLVDLLPDTNDDIKTIFAKERINLNDDKINDILNIINKYKL